MESMSNKGLYTFRKMDEACAREIATWQYDPPYEMYSFKPEDFEENVKGLLNPDYHYYSAWNEAGELVGYRCFGEDARVPGGDYRAEALDMGGGLRPDLTGQGLGAGFMEAAFDFAREQFAPRVFRATVAAFNQRALRVCEKVGYREVGRFYSTHTQQAFVVFVREVERDLP